MSNRKGRPADYDLEIENRQLRSEIQSLKDALKGLGGSVEKRRSPGYDTIGSRHEKHKSRYAREKYQESSDEESESAPKFAQTHFESPSETHETIPEIRIDESPEQSIENTLQRQKPSFYKQKIETLRETLKNIKEGIREEHRIPTVLESKCSTAKNLTKPVLSNIAKNSEHDTDPNLRFYQQEIMRLQEENKLLKYKLGVSEPYKETQLDKTPDNWIYVEKSMSQMKDKLKEYKEQGDEEPTMPSGIHHRRGKTERFNYMSNNKPQVEEESLGKLVSWEKSQEILRQCKRMNTGLGRNLGTSRTIKRGKSSSSRCCQNCMNLLYRGLSTRDCLYHKSPLRKR